MVEKTRLSFILISISNAFCFIQRFWLIRMLLIEAPDSACQFPDAEGDYCGKLINAVELIDRKCQICHSTS